jgi:hypothetical protein
MREEEEGVVAGSGKGYRDVDRAKECEKLSKGTIETKDQRHRHRKQRRRHRQGQRQTQKWREPELWHH